MSSTSFPCGALVRAALLVMFAPLAAEARLHDPDKPEPPPIHADHPGFVPPKVIDRVEPIFPEEARKAGLTATVLVQMVIGADGSVSNASIARAAGHGFDEAALAAARGMRFQPATHDGAPVPVQINYEVRFELQRLPALTIKETASGSEPAATAPASGPAAQPAQIDPALQATVEAERPFTAASARVVRDRDFLLRPRFTPEDILRVVPGLVLAQHQGGGKADQIFLRGFDADHGTDVSVNLDGIPVNMPSHAHGHGYSDLHFLIPEAIERVEVTKGPYFAELGDFDTAGAVNLVTRKKFDGSQVTLSGGTHSTYRILGVGSADSANLHPWFAAEVYGSQGPFLHGEHLQRYNLFGKVSYDLTPTTTLSVLGLAYASSWIGSGQVPARLVDAGFLDRYGAIDPTEGGITQRQQLIVSLQTRPDKHSTLTASASVIRYGLTLYNDFTFQAVNQLNGDEIEQDDARVSVLANLKYERTDRTLLPGSLVSTFGAQLRNDDISASLWKVQQRVRLEGCLGGANPCVDTNTRQTDAAAYLQEDWRPIEQLRVVLGLRSDLFEWDVRPQNGKVNLSPDDPAPHAPTVQRSVVSPKGRVVVSPVQDLELFFNFGSGFHSNDSRSAVQSGGSGALPRALGYEVGARTKLLDGKLDLAASLWRLDLESELVWSGDDGGTSASDATKRYGVDLEARLQILPWLFADLDASFAKSQYKTDAGNGNAVALAPPRIISGGLTARHPTGLTAAVRFRHIGPRPATQLTESDGVPQCTPDFDASTDAGLRCYLKADGYTVLDATLGYQTKRYAVTLLVENLTNATFREAQFGNVSQVIAPPDGNTVSRTTGQPFVPETHPVQDVHYTPGNPIGFLASLTLFF